MKEQLIEFETAKLAKQKGFDWDSYVYYLPDESIYQTDDPKDYNNKFGRSGTYSAPTQSLLQKWLREKHELHIALQRIFECNVEPVQFQGYVVYIGGKAFETDYPINKELVGNYFSTYEEALEDGLQETLKLIEL